MKLRTSCFFGFVLFGTLTACNNPPHWSQSSGDSGTSRFDSVSDAEAEVPLIIAPSSPTLAPCTSPYAPVLEAVPTGALLPVFANSTDGLSVGTGAADSTLPTDWIAKASVALPSDPSDVMVFAQVPAKRCPIAIEFAQKYSAVSSFAPAAGLAGSTAISKDDARLKAWATRVLAVNYGENVTAAWQTPDNAIGPATDSVTDVVSLGEGGTITLGFDVTLTDLDGYDFAVFENGFADDYLELAFVEVSSDGSHFIRFDTSSLVDASVSAYGTTDPTSLEGFAGKYRVGFGTPFDLAWLKARPEVRAGVVDLSRINAVRIVDIVGDGRVRDSLGHVVYDPYPTSGSAGFDLAAVGLLNAAP